MIEQKRIPTEAEELVLRDYLSAGGGLLITGGISGAGYEDNQLFNDWRDGLLNDLGAGGLAFAQSGFPAQSDYCPVLGHAITLGPSSYSSIQHGSQYNGYLDTLGNGLALESTTGEVDSLINSVALGPGDLTVAPEAQVVVYSNINQSGSGWTAFVTNAATWFYDN